MKMQRFTRLAFPAFLALLAGVSVHAEWTPTEYASEYESCLPPCDKNNPREHDQCVSYCHCVTDALQAAFSDRHQLVREAAQPKPLDHGSRLQRIADHCNHAIWKSPARKLKLR